jgi:hypothetical protein
MGPLLNMFLRMKNNIVYNTMRNPGLKPGVTEGSTPRYHDNMTTPDV